MTKLKRTFLHYNRRFFSSALPTDTIVKWADLGPMFGIFYSDGRLLVSKKHRKWNSVWRITLLHEMAHVATNSEHAAHGPRWKREMKRLMRIGAFDKLL
jgi:hypothetical protein